MCQLPADFLSAMKDLLGDDYDRYAAGISEEPYKGISVNRLKTDPERLLPLLPFGVEQSPFYEDGYRITGEAQGMGRLPLHHAGAFYVQEPSASSAVGLLQVRPGEKVLDLCAAPGGKSAQIASCLRGKGLLWSNEVVRSRAQILLSNMERMGVANGVVSSCFPEVLCEKHRDYFDKILVDAPCSGEGMFRKNPVAAAEWSREHVLACADRQLSILHSASIALRKGGRMVYSTCTFSREENEGVIQRFLETHPDFEPCAVTPVFGRPSGVSCGIRITPLEGGEGHFAAVLQRKGEGISVLAANRGGREREDPLAGTVRKELQSIFTELPAGRMTVIKDKAILLPEELPDLTGSGVIRAGVLAGEWKKNRLEPAHALFMASSPDRCCRVLSLSPEDPRLEDFLKGYEIDCSAGSGYTAVAAADIILGFGKCSGGRLKNKYPKGLRNTL